MTTYCFDKFVFDTESYELRADGVLLALRPKTAVLMGVLIEQRQQLLGKQALFSQVWRSDYVQDQSLFQAISEIRKTLAPLQPIKTHPNLGYQWVAPVKCARDMKWRGRLAGAVFSLLIAGAMLLTYWQTRLPAVEAASVQANTQVMLQSPAMRAFASGIEQLNNQNLLEAWEYFELAGRENPLFLEAGLMKAEILYEQADYRASEALTNDLLAQAISRGEHYIEVSAQGLLSRISEQTGQWGSALDWALKADNNARDQGFVCVAENTRSRVVDLLDETDLPVNEAWLLERPKSTDEEALANSSQDASHCESLRERASANDSQLDLSQCLDLGDGTNVEYEYLSMNQWATASDNRWT